MLVKNVLSALLAAGTAGAYVNAWYRSVRSPLTNVDSIPITKRGLGFNFGNETVRGVNIGGWLVLEPYADLGIRTVFMLTVTP